MKKAVAVPEVNYCIKESLILCELVGAEPVESVTGTENSVQNKI